MPAFSPYLVVRGIGNSGLVQPGRVIGGNNFVPLGNGFSGLENTTLNNTISRSNARIVQYGNDLFLWQRNGIRQYNFSTEDWDLIHTVTDQEDAADYNQHTGLHFLHDVNGTPILVGLADRESGTGVVRVMYDGSAWSSAVIDTVTNLDTPTRGVAVFQNKLYVHENNVVREYDPISGITQELIATSGSIAVSWTDMIVFDNRLFIAAQGNTGDILELIGGNFVARIIDAFPSNLSNPPSFFEKNDNLYVLYGSQIGNQGWELARYNTDIDTLTNLTDAVLPESIKQGSAVNPAINYSPNARSHVIVDQDSDPENPRVLLLINTNTINPTFGEITAWEFIDETQQLVEIPGAGNLTGEMFFPHNNFGSGAYNWTLDELNVKITGTEAVQDGEEISFIAYGDPGNPNKKVRIYFSNEQQYAKTPATLLSAGPATTGVTIGTDTLGDFVDGIDADNSTVYTVIRDIAADSALVGSRQVLMPYIERP